MPSLLWFRRDLRLSDNPALLAALADGPVVPLYVLDDDTPTHGYAMGAAQRWWLHHSLARLNESLGGKLVLRRGRAADVVADVAAAIGATSVHATRLYEPWAIDSERTLGDRLTLHDGETLVPPRDVTTGAGGPFKVYGAFWRALAAQLPPPPPLDAPERLDLADGPVGDRLDDWALLPTRPNWAGAFDDEFAPGEAAAQARLAAFAADASSYQRRRNLPSVDGTSRLSPHLHMGEISARQVWHGLGGARATKFLKEVAWRDFARQAILAQPSIGWESGREKMRGLAYRDGTDADVDFTAWTKGLTGYPIVDAGMRQLWVSGWMHNRVRMIVASFLTKHLLIHWNRGAMWFWDCLIDADYGNNSLNWQWIAGTGIASQPFNRIMAPLTQSPKFAAADYIRRWVPELAHLGDADIHDPPDDKRGAYPAKIVGHREGRERALAALAASRD